MLSGTIIVGQIGDVGDKLSIYSLIHKNIKTCIQDDPNEIYHKLDKEIRMFLENQVRD